MDQRNLHDRIRERKEEFQKLCHSERITQIYIDKVLSINKNFKVDVSTLFENCSFIYFTKSGIEDFEINILPQLSDKLGVKWRKWIHEEKVSYTSELTSEPSNFRIYFTFNITPEDTCVILAMPTGKVRKEPKTIYVDVPVIDYRVSCGGSND